MLPTKHVKLPYVDIREQTYPNEIKDQGIWLIPDHHFSDMWQ
jgi:hypothetical protein